MKNRVMEIKECITSEKIYTILFENAVYEENIFNFIEKIVKTFINDNVIFFTFWRKDGVNITYKQFKRYSEEIPCFFNSYGEIFDLDEYMSIAKINISDISVEMFSHIFHYYLDTCLFVPKISWDKLKEFHSDYMNHSIDDYIFNGVTDLLFRYYDSGDFSISFNVQKYNVYELKDTILKIMLDNNFSVLLKKNKKREADKPQNEN